MEGAADAALILSKMSNGEKILSWNRAGGPSPRRRRTKTGLGRFRPGSRAGDAAGEAVQQCAPARVVGGGAEAVRCRSEGDGFVLDGPALPFTEGVVGPVPAVLAFEECVEPLTDKEGNNGRENHPQYI